jgi:2-keto-3-deoxy-L-rhamnonate aldolase RhmA
MTHSSLTSCWSEDRAAIGGWVTGGGEFTFELYRRAGYDYVGIDCQHSLNDETDAARLLVRAAGGPATIVRVSANNAALIGRVCDAGADGIIVPLVNTVAEAEAAVAAIGYPPHGARSFGPMRPDVPPGDLMAMAQRVAVFVMIETAEGLANVEAIAAVPGLAGIYVGPADLSIGLGLHPGDAYSTDQLVEAVARIGAACQANGIVLGMHQRDADSAVEWIARGARLVSLGGDGAMFLAAAKAALTRAKSV